MYCRPCFCLLTSLDDGRTRTALRGERFDVVRACCMLRLRVGSGRTRTQQARPGPCECMYSLSVCREAAIASRGTCARRGCRTRTERRRPRVKDQDRTIGPGPRRVGRCCRTRQCSSEACCRLAWRVGRITDRDVVPKATRLERLFIGRVGRGALARTRTSGPQACIRTVCLSRGEAAAKCSR